MANESILHRLEGSGKSAPRIRLRPLSRPEGDERTPGGNGDRYQILGEIARGGMGRVLRAHDVDLGRDVAMKVLRDRHLQSPELVQRFVEEAQVGGQLQHPGIVPVYELGLRGDREPFFAMKLVKGKSLAEVLDTRREVEEDRRKILADFEQVCLTVAYAHSRGVIHRDLKPSNVMIGAFGEVQVVDWGFAKVLARGGVADERRSRLAERNLTRIATVRSESDGSASLTGSVMGTPAYMPPEQALGHVEDLDERSDVFSLGAILTEILTAQPPYTEERGDLLVQAAEADLANAGERLKACGADAELISLARRCLSPVPKDRPRNGGEVAAVITEYLATVEARAHASRLRTIKEQQRGARDRSKAKEAVEAAAEQRRRRRQTLALAGAAMVALLVAGAAWFFVQEARAERIRVAGSAVEKAMEEALRFRGTGELAALDHALRAVQRADALAAGSDVGPKLKKDAAALFAEIGEEHLQATESARIAAEDQAMLVRLEEIRLSLIEHGDGMAGDREYAEAFLFYGVDMNAVPPAKAGARLSARAIAVPLAAALDDWSWIRRHSPGVEKLDWRRMCLAAGIADPDPDRARLRQAILDGDRARVVEWAESIDVESQSPVTLDLMARFLGEGRDPEINAAVNLLRRAHLAHPADFWINRFLTHYLLELDPPRAKESVRHARAALALRPDSARLRAGLGRAQSFAEEQSESIEKQSD